MTVESSPVEGSAAVGRRRVERVRACFDQHLDYLLMPLGSGVYECRAPEVVGFVGVAVLLQQRNHRALAATVCRSQQVLWVRARDTRCELAPISYGRMPQPMYVLALTLHPSSFFSRILSSSLFSLPLRIWRGPS